MSVSDIKAKAKEQAEAYQEELKALKKRFTDRGSEIFKEASAALFAENPELKSFSWQQYTIYFNDGDDCNFSVYRDYPSINDVSGYDIDDKDDYKELYKVQQKVASFLKGFDEDLFETLFGDHVEITVTPDKVTVESYHDHD
jgi:hypothetical protein